MFGRVAFPRVQSAWGYPPDWHAEDDDGLLDGSFPTATPPFYPAPQYGAVCTYIIIHNHITTKSLCAWPWYTFQAFSIDILLNVHAKTRCGHFPGKKQAVFGHFNDHYQNALHFWDSELCKCVYSMKWQEGAGLIFKVGTKLTWMCSVQWQVQRDSRIPKHN